MTEWTARICAAFWLAALFAPKRPQEVDGGAFNKQWRILWIIGAVSLAVHTAAAFHFKHDWSHAQAYAFTAKMTLETIGLDWGGGLYFNYLTALWWLVDAVAVWFEFGWIRNKAYRLIIESYLLFMFINATVVFGPSFWIGIGVAVLVAMLYLQRKRANRAS